MVDTLALEYLFDSVVTRFTSESTAATNHFGWREPAKQLGASGGRGDRIVWTPGDPNGSVGTVQSAREPGHTPDRSIATLAELFTVEITATDTANLEDELRQYAAARLLFDAWYRACYKAVSASVLRVQSANWLRGVGDSPVRRHGATIRAVCTILAKIPDAQLTPAPADTDAKTAVKSLDVSETQTVEAPE